MRTLRLLLTFQSAVAISLLAATSLTAQSEFEPAPLCNAPEVSNYNLAYDQLVCDAVKLLGEQKYPEALTRLLEARGERAPDGPTVGILGRIALTQALLGRHDDAWNTAADAEMVVSLYSGILACVDDGRPTLLHRKSGEYRPVPPRQRELLAEVCGEEFLGSYGSYSLPYLKKFAGMAGVIRQARGALPRSASAQSEPEPPPLCDAPELSGYVQAYDAAVCEGVRLLGEKKYEDALRSLLLARSTRMTDTPSVSVLGRIALTQALLGRYGDARNSLADAELAISVEAGILRCIEGDARRLLNYDGEVRVVTQRQRALVVELCGEIFIDMYGLWSLAHLEMTGALLGIAEQARRSIPQT